MSFGTELIKQLDRVAGVKKAPRLEEPYDTARGTRARVAYILSPKTGASVATVAALARVAPSTVRRWASGSVPSPEFRGQIDDVYSRFAAINQRAKDEVTRQRGARKVILAVKDDALKVVNTEGDFRYYKPSFKWWPRLISDWVRRDVEELNKAWDAIIEDWDYPEPWGADLIEDVTIV